MAGEPQSTLPTPNPALRGAQDPPPHSGSGPQGPSWGWKGRIGGPPGPPRWGDPWTPPFSTSQRGPKTPQSLPFLHKTIPDTFSPFSLHRGIQVPPDPLLSPVKCPSILFSSPKNLPRPPQTPFFPSKSNPGSRQTLLVPHKISQIRFRPHVPLTHRPQTLFTPHRAARGPLFLSQNASNPPISPTE